MGEWCLIQRHHIVKGLSKTLYQYSEPMQISKKFSPVLYELTKKNGEILPDRYNVARLVKVPKDSETSTAPATKEAAHPPMLILEDCAGTAQLSHAFQDVGFSVEAANENDPIARELCQKRLGPSTTISNDLRKLPHTELEQSLKKRVRVLAGGYPCQWISLANPERLGVDDTRSNLASISLDATLADPGFNANMDGNLTIIIAENVPNKEYEGFEVAQAEAAIAEKYGYSRSTFEVMSMHYGDPQHRIRSISWTEPAELTKQLGRPEAPAPPLQELPALESLLLKPEDRPAELWIEDEETQFQATPHILVTEQGPHRVGFLYIKGTCFPVWSTESVAWTIRASGEPPKFSGGAIYWDQRVNKCFTLSAEECWKIQGLPLDVLDILKETLSKKEVSREETDTIIRRLAGNAISTGVATALAQMAKDRIRKFDALFRKNKDGSAKLLPPHPGSPTRKHPEDSINKFIIVQLTPGLVKGEQWRVGQIKELRTDSGDKDQPNAIVQFYESYKKQKDLTKRSYHAVWIDPTKGQEIYSNKAPTDAEAMTDLVQYEQRLTEPFELEKGGALPFYIAKELRPVKYTITQIDSATLVPSINLAHADKIQDILQDITHQLEAIEPFPLQERRNYSVTKNEGFILGWSRSFDFATQHLRPAASNVVFPKLLQLMSKVIKLQDPDFSFKSIQVNKSSGTVKEHKDAYNIGCSYIIALGSYTDGGELLYDQHPYDIKRKFLKIDGRVPHRPLPHNNGSRYSLVYFTPTPKITDVSDTRATQNQPPSKKAKILVTRSEAHIGS